MRSGFGKRKMWGLVVFVIICLVVIVSSITYEKDLLKLKTESVTVEYGQSVSTDLNDYLDFSNLSNKEKKDVLKNTKYKSNVENELETITNQDNTISQKDRGFAKIGNYKITLTYRNEVEVIKVKVRDTVVPQINGPDNIEIIQGTDLTTFNFKSLISASDLSQLNDIMVDYSAIDTNTLGEYMVKVFVEDVNKNRTEKEFKVTIIEAMLDIEQQTTINSQKNKITNKKERPNTSNRNSSNPNSSNSSSGNNRAFGSENDENKGNTGESNSGNNGGSSSEEIKPVDPNPPKIKVYWARCGCGYYVESTASIEDAKNKLYLAGHGNGNNGMSNNGDCYHYRYGVIDK